MTAETEGLLWGHGYGSKRHVVDVDRPVGNQRIGREFLAICSPANGTSSPAKVALDEFSDDHTRDRYEIAGRTHAENVMRLKPCLRCCKKLGIDPDSVPVAVAFGSEAEK